MSQAALSQLAGIAVIAVWVGFLVTRRMRPQPVRPDRFITSGILIVLVLGASLVGTGGRIISDPVALALIPVFAVAGVALGYYLVRTMAFWTDPASGKLWMKGGALFAVILVGTIVIRLGIRALVTGSAFGTSTANSPSQGLLYDLTADLIFLSLGLWIARAYFLYQRYRQHAATTQPTAV